MAEDEESVGHRILNGSVSTGGALSTAEKEDADILLRKNLSGGELNVRPESIRHGGQQVLEPSVTVSRVEASRVGRVPSSNAGLARA